VSDLCDATGLGDLRDAAGRVWALAPIGGGELGEILPIEGHLSNDNSGNLFAPWCDAPGESPGGGMTGSGLHVLDAFIRLSSRFEMLQRVAASLAGETHENSPETQPRLGVDPVDQRVEFQPLTGSERAGPAGPAD